MNHGHGALHHDFEVSSPARGRGSVGMDSLTSRLQKRHVGGMDMADMADTTVKFTLQTPSKTMQDLCVTEGQAEHDNYILDTDHTLQNHDS